MLIEGYLALVLLVVLVFGAYVLWADHQYQQARRTQRQRALGRQ